MHMAEASQSMIFNSLDTQFKLSEDGAITWQRDLTDPRPGDPVALVAKGESLTAPVCQVLQTAPVEETERAALQTLLQGWLNRHIRSALEPLFRLKEDDIAQGVPSEIAEKLFDALGILPREDLQDLIAAMDEAGRNSLRSKKIRFGPIIVYLPELNKPAMVRLRALLLSLWENKLLPAEAPHDGIVSFSVADKDLDAEYYRSLGYPVYGSRSIRVDMLDRLICRVYDSAVAGKFQAEHQMAEWLGCSIPDLYLVLEAMGHKKIYDPADDIAQEHEKSAELQEENQENVKPELATFAIKSNKALKPKIEQKKPSKKKQQKNKKPHNPPRQKIYTAEAKNKPEDSPFAILEQLKNKN